MWLNENEPQKTLDLPSLDQYQAEIYRRTGEVNELEKQIKNLKEVKESLVAQTHSIFKETEARLVQKEQEAQRLAELASLNKNEAAGKLETIAHAEKAQSDVTKSLEAQKKVLANKIKEADKALADLMVNTEALKRSSLLLDNREQTIQKRELTLNLKEVELNAKQEQLEKLNEETSAKLEMLDKRFDELDEARFENNVKILEAEEKNKKALEVLSAAKEKEQKAVALFAEVEKQRNTFEDKKLEILQLTVKNQETLKILCDKEKVVNEKINQLNDLQGRMNNLK